MTNISYEHLKFKDISGVIYDILNFDELILQYMCMYNIDGLL